MSYTDRKITQAEINAHHVQGATDYLIGNPQQNKAVFDNLPEFIAGKFNDLIDEIAGQHGDEIKVAVDEWLAEHPEVTTTVQDNSLTTAKYVDGSVTEPKIAAGAVTPSRLDRAYSTTDDLASVNANLTNELNVLDARMDEFATLPEGSTTADAELMDIRVGADGETYSTAGDAVRGQVAGLKSDLNVASSDLSKIDNIIRYDSSNFDIGTIYTGSYPWAYNWSTVRVRTKQGFTLKLKEGDTICLRDYTTYRYFLGWIDGNGTTGQTAWLTSDYVCKVDGDYVVTIGRKTEATVTSVSEYSNLLYVKTFGYDSINVTQRMDDLLTMKDFSNLLELGNIYATAGNPPSYSASTTRVRTADGTLIPLKKGDTIYLTDLSAARMYIGWQRSDGTWTYFNYWVTNPAIYRVTEDGNYWILLTAVPEATVSDIADLGSLLRIKKGINVETDIIAKIDKNQRKNWFVKSVNHRGYNRLCPENTLPAFKKSAQLGWGTVETDVRYTSDRVAMLLHDESINRTARNADGTSIGSTVNIADITYAESQTYDFGIWKGSEFEGTKIPTFKEFVTLCRNLSLDMYIELKVADTNPLVTIVKECGMLNHATWISYSEGLLGSVQVDLGQAGITNARLGLLANTLTDSVVDNALALRASGGDVFVGLSTSGVDSTAISTLISNNLPLEVFTPNSATAINNLDPYVSGVTSDSEVAGRDLYDLNI